MTPTRSTTAAGLFDGSMTPGVYHLIAPRADVVAALTEHGWKPGVLIHGDTREEFLANVATALEFPAHYGRNLDALWDCLRDLEVPTALVWASWHELAIEHPSDWDAIVSLLTDRTREEGLAPFAVVLG